MASVQSRTNRSGSSSHRLHYRWRGKQEVITFDDLDAANSWCAIFNAAGVEQGLRMLAAELGTPAEPQAEPVQGYTVREVVEHHIEHLTGVTDGTRADYRREAEWEIYPTLGDLPVTAVDDDVATKWVNSMSSQDRCVNGKLRGPLSGKTIKNRHGLMSAAFSTAVRRKLISHNPFYGLRLPETVPLEMTFLSTDEWWILHDSVHPFYQSFVKTLVGTGLRWGEATALRVCDIDMPARKLHVVQAWKSAGASGRVLGPPKTTAGKRWVPFGEECAQSLEPLLVDRAPTDLVFVNMAGDRIQTDSFHSNIWPNARKAAQKAGLQKHVRVHDLRHTFASWQLASGEVSLFSLAVVIGHDDLKLLRKRYGHLLPAAALDVARVADAALKRPTRLALAPAVSL